MPATHTPGTGAFSPVAIIGAGRVGRALAVVFHRLGARVTLGVRDGVDPLPAGPLAELRVRPALRARPPRSRPRLTPPRPPVPPS